MEYVFSRKWGVELHYSLVCDRKVLRIEGRRFGDHWIDYYPLAEFSPICQVSTSSGRSMWKDMRSYLILCMIFLFLAVAMLLCPASAKDTELAVFGAVMSGLATVSGLCSGYFWLDYRNDRRTQVIFHNFFRQWSFSVSISPKENIDHPFIRELRKAIAECFQLPVPPLSSPGDISQLNDEYDVLLESGALTGEEYELLYRNLFGGKPVKRSIGFNV